MSHNHRKQKSIQGLNNLQYKGYFPVVVGSAKTIRFGRIYFALTNIYL